MNVIISNKYKQELDNLEIDISKKLEGEHEVDEIIDTFSNYFFNKMIIDITSIKNYQNISNLQKLSINLNVEKIIFLLDRENVNPSFLSQLVSIGIYNFTTTEEGIMYLYNNPNSYRDVVQYQDSNYTEFAPKEEKEKMNVNKEIETRQDNFDAQVSNSTSNYNGQHIIGIKNITNGAGATTLTYILKKELSKYKDVVAIEINKKDFIFFRDSELVSVESKNLKNELDKHKNKDIILIDLNNSSDSNLCTDIIYLIEPTTIKLNKMIVLDRKVFEKLQGKKIILNKTILDKKDISSFEFESNSKVFYTLPPLDEKSDNKEKITPLLEKLNLLENYSDGDNGNNDKFLNFFKI